MKLTDYVLFSRNTRRVNLRHASGCLCGIGSPEIIGSHGADANFVEGACHVSPTGLSYLFFMRGGSLFSVCTENGDELEVEAGIPSLPVAIVSVDGGVVAMYSGISPRRYKLGSDGLWERSELFPEGPYTINRLDLGKESVAVGPVSLKGSYDGRSVRLDARDSDAVCAAALEAYRTLAGQATAAHRFVQPVMARYRLFGDGGVLLYESAPVLVAAADGEQMRSASFTVEGSGFNTTSSLSVSASAFGLELTRAVVETEAERRLVRSVSLVVSPQFHPVDPALPGTCRYKGHSGSVISFECMLPGVNPYTATGSPGGNVYECVAGVLAAPDSFMRRYDSPVPSFDAELKELAKIRKAAALAADPSGRTAVRHEMAAPHTFSAATGAVNGGTVVWGNITAIPFNGYRMHEFAVKAAKTQGGGPVAALVTMADGSSVATAVTVYGVSLSAFSPLLLYPSGRAVSITLIAEGMRQTYPLTPTPDGRWAFWLEPSAKPHMPAATEAPFVVPASSPGLVELPGYLAVARASDPLTPLSGTDTTAGSVSAIVPAPRGGLTREFARGSFYVMGSGGTDGVAVSASLTSVVASHIDSRSVAGPSAVAVVRNEVMFVSGREIVRLSGSKALTFFTFDGWLMAEREPVAIGWSPFFRELWVAGRPRFNLLAGSVDMEMSGPVTAVVPLDGDSSYRRTDFTPDFFVHTPSGTVAVDSAGCTRRLAVEKNRLLSVGLDASVPVSRPAGPRWSRHTLVADLSGDGRLSGSISLAALPQSGLDGLADALSLGSATVSGVIDHPVAVPFMLPHLHNVALSIRLSSARPVKLRIRPWKQNR